MLNRRFEVQERVQDDDEYGEPKDSWMTIRAIWGSLRGAKASERVEADNVQGYRSHVAKIRFDPDLTPAHRLKSRGDVFQIDGIVDEDDRRRWMTVWLVVAHDAEARI